jgi:hypothetical protein
MRLVRALRPLAASVVPSLSSFAHGHNYNQADGPRYAGRFGRAGSLGRLRIVTFNLQFGREIERALGYDYVYYPAAFHPLGGQDFGNGIMVRGRILSDHKVPLPHPSRSRRLQRIAVAADVEVAGLRLRAYSVHLETPAEI